MKGTGFSSHIGSEFGFGFSRRGNATFRRPSPGAKQAAEKHTPAADFRCFVTGHDFSRADKANQINVGLQPLQKLLSAIRSSKALFRSL
jgi:hypothetical protein